MQVVSIGGVPSEWTDLQAHVERIMPFPLQIVYKARQMGLPRIESNYFVKSLFPFQIVASMKKISNDLRPDVVQVLDNYGPAQTIFSTLPGRKITFLLSYSPRYPLFDKLLLLSLRPFDKIVTGSDSVARKLISLGLSKDSVQTIPFGVNPELLRKGRAPQVKTKMMLNANPQAKLIVWSGFFPGEGEADYRYAVWLARGILEKTADIAFVFLFKPAHFRRRYLRDAVPPRLTIVPCRDNQHFLDIVSSAVGFLSPIVNPRLVMAPPLTWLESMALGVPIITTRVGGAESILEDRTNGLLFSDAKECYEKVTELCGNESFRKSLSRSALRLVEEEYNYDHVASAYLEMWHNLAPS